MEFDRKPKPLELLLGSIVLSAFVIAPAVAQQGHGHHQSMQSNAEQMHGEEMSGHSHEMSEVHGGHVTMTPSHHFEVLCTQDAGRVYLYDAEQKPIMDPSKVDVQITLKRKGKDDVQLTPSYVAPNEKEGRAQGYFVAEYDFGSADMSAMKAVIQVSGLADEPIEFRTPLVMGHMVAYTCPMGCNDGKTYEDPMPCPKCGMDMTRADSGSAMQMHGHHGEEQADGNQAKSESDSHGHH